MLRTVQSTVRNEIAGTDRRRYKGATRRTDTASVFFFFSSSSSTTRRRGEIKYTKYTRKKNIRHTYTDNGRLKNEMGKREKSVDFFFPTRVYVLRVIPYVHGITRSLRCTRGV